MTRGPGPIDNKIALCNPGTNAKGQRVVDLCVDGMGLGYVILDGGYTVEDLAKALDAVIVVDF